MWSWTWTWKIETSMRHQSYLGKRKQRPICVIVSARPTAPAKRVRHLTRTNNYNIQVPCGKWDLPVVINTNIRSVVPKITELSEILKLNRADIATITETWCRDHIPDESISVPGYFHIRKNRADRRGRGVMCFVKHGIPFKEWIELRNNDMETLWISLRPHNATLTLASSYLVISTIFQNDT